MTLKKPIVIILTLILASIVSSCSILNTDQTTMMPQMSQMKSICQLATMECYYHNVAKFKLKDASGILLWKKDKHFWIEYSGTVKIGIDTSLVSIEVNENSVTITIPKAKVLSHDVDDLTKESFIVAKDSAKITAEDETLAFTEAQEHMIVTASGDTALLASAQQRAQTLLEEYIDNIGKAVGKEYLIEWIYLDDDGNLPADTTDESTES